MRRFFLLFLLIQCVLFTVEIIQTVQESVIVPWTELIAATSAWLIQLFDNQVLANGVIIQSANFGVAIRPGCIRGLSFSSKNSNLEWCRSRYYFHSDFCLSHSRLAT